MGAMEQLKPLHSKFADTHKDLHAIFTAPTIDRSALEQLRAARMADVDEGSKILVQALADAADVLTPEQRAKIGAAMAHHHEGIEHHHG
jgi:Spy/CpxP family protein refolding chaperone